MIPNDIEFVVSDFTGEEEEEEGELRVVETALLTRTFPEKIVPGTVSTGDAGDELVASDAGPVFSLPDEPLQLILGP